MWPSLHKWSRQFRLLVTHAKPIHDHRRSVLDFFSTKRAPKGMLRKTRIGVAVLSQLDAIADALSLPLRPFRQLLDVRLAVNVPPPVLMVQLATLTVFNVHPLYYAPEKDVAILPPL